MKIRNRFLSAVVEWTAVRLIRLLFFTCRKVVVAEEPNTCAYEETGEERFLYCVWHDQVVMTLFMKRPVRMAGLASGHRDGGYVTAAMRAQRIASVRGSSSKRAAGALRALIDVSKTHHIAITPDGPRGPRREMKSGIVYLAAQTGNPICAAAYTARRLWRIRGNWTDMILPRPFTTLYLYIGRRVAVPPDADREALDEFTRQIADEMAWSEACAESLAAGRELPQRPPTEREQQQQQRPAAA